MKSELTSATPLLTLSMSFFFISLPPRIEIPVKPVSLTYITGHSCPARTTQTPSTSDITARTIRAVITGQATSWTDVSVRTRCSNTEGKYIYE